MPVTATGHIHCDEDGTAWLDDTGVKVVEIVREHIGHGWSAEVIQENHLHLSLAQIHAALAWFYDHEAEMVAELVRRDAETDALFSGLGEGPLQRRLRQLKASRAE